MRSFGSRPEVRQLGPGSHARAFPSWLCGRREAPWQRALRPPLCAPCSVTGMGRLREARWYLWKRWEPISSDPSHPPRCLASGHLSKIQSPLLSFGCAVGNLGPQVAFGPLHSAAPVTWTNSLVPVLASQAPASGLSGNLTSSWNLPKQARTPPPPPPQQGSLSTQDTPPI